jgi:siderophore synthetase component
VPPSHSTDSYAVTEEVLTAERWRQAGRHLVAKLLSELSYEELLQARPQPGAAGRYRVDLPDGVAYSFAASPRLLDRLQVEPTSVRRHAPGAVAALADDPVRLLLDARDAIGIAPATAAHLVRELSSTLLADAHGLARQRRSAAELVDLDYAEIEGELDGHPWIAASKGRIGFGYGDYLRYAPERAEPLRPVWLAARTPWASYQAVGGLDHARLLAAELDAPVRAAFAARLRRRAADPDAYVWLPVHPWQWDNVVLPLFAAELAAGDLVVLGDADDDYLPQQSIRTLSNLTAPRRHHLKLPLSVLNTLVWRGLPTERALLAPRVTAFLKGIRDADPFLSHTCGLILLGEVASVAIPHRAYERLPGAPYQFRELLGCIWREPLARFLEPGERACALAALLRVDAHGTPVVAAMVERSGLGPAAWLERFLGAVLPPLLHYLYRYGTVFSPHGENAILVHREGVPARLALKDFVDDVNLSDQPLPELEEVPAEVAEVLLREPPAWLCQFLQAGLFVGHFRYLADLMEASLGLAERRFWQLVRAEVLAYQARFPELEQRYATFDLLAPRFTRICLNRNRLLLDGYADRPERPHAATHGSVRNPLAEVASASPSSDPAPQTGHSGLLSSTIGES